MLFALLVVSWVRAWVAHKQTHQNHLQNITDLPTSRVHRILRTPRRKTIIINIASRVGSVAFEILNGNIGGFDATTSSVAGGARSLAFSRAGYHVELFLSWRDPPKSSVRNNHDTVVLR